MKKAILSSTFLASVFCLSAQITVNRSHLIVSGQVVIQSTDTNSRAIQTAGTNKTWDFSSLTSTEKDTLKFNPPQWYPGYTNFPNANLAEITTSDDSSFNYIKIDNNSLKVEGTYELVGDSFRVNKFSKTIITFPSTYNTSFTETILFPSQTFPYGMDPDGGGPAPFIDSIRVTPQVKVSSKVDGWGSIITPIGTYNCIMQSEMDINTAGLEMYTGLWITIPQSVADQLGFNFTDTSYTHQFWTDDASVGFPLVTYGYSHGETTTSSVDWLQTKPQNNGIGSNHTQKPAFVYPNPATSSFKVVLPDNENAQVIIYDMNGKVAKKGIADNGSNMDISDMNNGIYTVKYISNIDGRTIQTMKLIKY